MITFRTCRPDNADDVLIVELSGHLDTEAAEEFFNRLDHEINQGHLKLIFDCQRLEHISSLGFGMMIRAHSRVQRAGGAVRFARLQGMILEAFQIVGFHKLFNNFDTVEEAAKSLSDSQ